MKGKFPRIHPAAIIILLLVVFLTAGSPATAFAGTKLMVVSDLHYLEPSLYRDSELFLQVLRKGDGKITQFSEELLAALYRELLAEQPDALIVTGDLSFNGEKKSHEALADWFGTVEQAEIPVWVIPGNHDINTSSPVGFSEEMYYGVAAASPEDFSLIYADYMEPGEAGFSYLAKVSSSLWVAMTDVSWYQDQAQTFGIFTARHDAWLEKALKQAHAEGVHVVAATHHSLLAHTDFSRESYLMFGSEGMAALLRRYGVKLNLSGHLHIQHIVQENGLADAALGAFCIWPHRYAIVTLDDDGMLSYDARSLSSRFLPDGFLEDSREWFAGISAEKAGASLTGTEEEIAVMADYASRFSLAYFSGTYRKDDPSWTEDPTYALWECQDTPSWIYTKQVMNEASGNSLHLDLP